VSGLEGWGRFFIGDMEKIEKRVTANKKAVPHKCEGCKRWKSIRQQVRVNELLTTTITKLKARFEADDFKPSVGAYLKLVELEEQLEQESDAIKEIKVTWVEAPASETEQ
jgi:hypothetical protein